MTDPQFQPLCYSIKQAIEVSTFGRTRLYELINDGTLKATRIGRRTLIDAQSLRSLVAPDRD